MVQYQVPAEPGACVGVAVDLGVEHRWGWESAALLLATRGEMVTALNSTTSRFDWTTQLWFHTCDSPG